MNMDNYMLYTDENGEQQFKLPLFQKMLLGMRNQAGSSMVISEGIRIKGLLRQKKLEFAINQLYEENDAFRMIFIHDDQDIKISIIKKYEYHLNVIMAEGNTVDEKFEYVKKRIKEDASVPIDITSEVGVRFFIYEIAQDDHVLLIVGDHAVFDGGSMIVTIKELIENYMIPASEKKIKEKLSLLDYYKEKNNAEANYDEKYTDYWLNEIKGFKQVPLECIENPEKTEFPEGFKISKKICDEAARKLRVSPFALSMSAYHYAITKVYGQLDTLIPFVSMDRFDKRYRNTTGPMLEGAYNRIIIDPEEGVSEYIKRVSAKIIENQNNSLYMPYTAPEYVSISRTPLFSMSYENTEAAANADKYENAYKISIIETEVKRKGINVFGMHANSGVDTIEFFANCDEKLWDKETAGKLLMYMKQFMENTAFEGNTKMKDLLSL
ncbi:MAG: hypothetical protein IJA12_06985 [Oscillospiraceae bacterium]|nr:hypothetical protein [Oscillospiraceae bacterium]